VGFETVASGTETMLSTFSIARINQGLQGPLLKQQAGTSRIVTTFGQRGRHRVLVRSVETEDVQYMDWLLPQDPLTTITVEEEIHDPALWQARWLDKHSTLRPPTQLFSSPSFSRLDEEGEIEDMPAPHACVDFHPSGSLLACGFGVGDFQDWSSWHGVRVVPILGARDTEPVPPLPNLDRYSVQQVRFSPDGTKLAVSTSDLQVRGQFCSVVEQGKWWGCGGSVHLFDTATGLQLWRSFAAPELLAEQDTSKQPAWDMRINALAWRPDGKHLVGGSSYWARVWKAEDGERVPGSVMFHDQPDPPAEEARSSSRTDSNSQEGSNIQKGGWLFRQPWVYHPNVTLVSYSPDGSMIATLDSHCQLRVFVPALGYSLVGRTTRQGGTMFPPHGLDWTPDGNILVCEYLFSRGYEYYGVSKVDPLTLWHRPLLTMLTGKQLHELVAVKVAPAGKDSCMLLTGHYDGHVRVWDMESRECVHEMKVDKREHHVNAIASISVSCTGLIAAGTSKGEVWVWQLPEAARMH